MEMYQFPADKLQLFLAKTADGKWLLEESDTAQKLAGGETVSEVMEMIIKKKMLSSWAIEETLDDFKMTGELAPRSKQVHVLVLVSDGPSLIAQVNSERTHSESRRKRWRELNDIFDKNKKAKTNNEDGDVRWSDVKGVFVYESYIQKCKPIPADKLKFLCDYLAYASKAMNGYDEALKEAKRSHFIAPILIMLCGLFDDAKLGVEESVDGNNVDTNGYFEFVLTRGKTKICVMAAKKNDFEQGKAEALVGCEVVADREGVFVVYSIVTDFIEWHLYRSGENSILRDSCTLAVSSNTLDIKSLRDMCEMIYGALSNHEEESKIEKRPCVE
ncbi:hypothetical protein PR002_g16602 [Phytophthora rubi]|nr:hypothetical protein PR002_g16602 [Phytophthora rubi]